MNCGKVLNLTYFYKRYISGKNDQKLSPVKKFDQLFFTTNRKFAPTFFLPNRIFYRFLLLVFLLLEENHCSGKECRTKKKSQIWRSNIFQILKKKKLNWFDLKLRRKEWKLYQKTTFFLLTTFWGSLLIIFFDDWRF